MVASITSLCASDERCVMVFGFYCYLAAVTLGGRRAPTASVGGE